MENVLQLYLDGARTTRRFPISVRLVASPPGQGAARRKLQRQYSYCRAPHTHPTHVATARHGTARHGTAPLVLCPARPERAPTRATRRESGDLKAKAMAHTVVCFCSSSCDQDQTTTLPRPSCARLGFCCPAGQCSASYPSPRPASPPRLLASVSSLCAMHGNHSLTP